MSIEEALQLIDNVLSRVTASRADHDMIRQAMSVIIDACRQGQSSEFPKLAEKK